MFFKREVLKVPYSTYQSNNTLVSMKALNKMVCIINTK